MNIVFFSHPKFISHKSMDRFKDLLMNNLHERGHQVEELTAKAFFFQLPLPNKFKKWLSYADQFLVFPIKTFFKIRKYPKNTLFVFLDHALGPWVPLVKNRHHVIHCHDFLAQRSALGETPEHVTGWSGQMYQALIKWGYCQGNNFLSVSYQTQKDLHRFLISPPNYSKVIYNALNPLFTPIEPSEAKNELGLKIGLNLSSGYLLHIGGNMWYKNRKGVLEIYIAWRSQSNLNIPLLMLGEQPTEELIQLKENSLFKNEIHFFSNLDDTLIHFAYAGATLLLFPSFAEGFGWPIAEAMASGCPVITTDEAPMNEVAGNAGIKIPRKPSENSQINAAHWAIQAAEVVEKIINLKPIERDKVIKQGLETVQRFKLELILKQLELEYNNILISSMHNLSNFHEDITSNR